MAETTSGPLIQVRPRWADDQAKPGWNGVLIHRAPELLVLRAGVSHPGAYEFVTLEPGDVFFERSPTDSAAGAHLTDPH